MDGEFPMILILLIPTDLSTKVCLVDVACGQPARVFCLSIGN